MTRAGRAVIASLAALTMARLRRWSFLFVIALTALVALTACYYEVTPTPSAEQVPAPDGDDGAEPPPPAPPDENGDDGGDQPPPPAPDENGDNGDASPEASPIASPGTAVAPPPPPDQQPTVTATRTAGQPPPPGPPDPANGGAQPTTTVRPPNVPTTAAQPTATKTSPAGPTATATTETGGPTVTTGGILITKLDPSNNPIEGACFSLLDDEEQEVVTVCDQEPGDLDQEPGSILISDVPEGSYTLRETFAPVGFTAGPEQPVVIIAGTPSGIDVFNDPAESTGAIIVTKIDPNGTPVGEACFAVLAQGTPEASACDAGEGDTDTQIGSIRIDIAPGSYTLVETPPAGYEAAEPVELTVEAGAFATIEIVNQPAGAATSETTTEPEPGAIRIDKVDAVTGDPLGGACFTLTTTEPVAEVCDNQEGDADSADGAINIEDLPPGQYTVTESAAPAGYVAGAEQSTEVLAGETRELVFSNAPEPTATATVAPLGSLTVEARSENGDLLPGACYSLTPRSGTEGGEKQQVCDADDDADDGITTFTDLAPGQWRLRQYQPPEGLPEPPSVDVEIVAGETTPQSIVNLPAITTGSLQITITDDQGQPVGGTCFNLIGQAPFQPCDNDEFDANGDEGVILSQGLPPDVYMVTQVQTPDGYQKPADQEVTVAAGSDPAQLAFTMVPQTAPAGIDLASPVVYTDDLGRLWLLRPGDAEPIRLDSDQLTFNGATAPVFSVDRSWLAFLVNNPDIPGANLTLYNVNEGQSYGQVDFSSVGTPVALAQLPGANDAFAVAALTPSGATADVYFYTALSGDAPGVVFGIGLEPISIDGMFAAPSGNLLAIEATGSDGDKDVYVVDASNRADPSPVSVGPTANGDLPDAFAGWSPTGDRLLVRSGPEPQSLFVTDAAAAAVPLGGGTVFPGDPNNSTNPRFSPDGSWIAFFDNDPQTGGQLHVAAVDGTEPCGPIANVIAFDWSPADGLLTMLVSVPNEPVHLVNFNPGDCQTQPIADFDQAADKLLWAPGGQVLAVIDRSDTGASAWLVSGNQPTQIDLSAFGMTDVFAWSPEGDALPIFATGPAVSLWVLAPGATAPVVVNGSTIPEGASYMQQVWWPN